MRPAKPPLVVEELARPSAAMALSLLSASGLSLPLPSLSASEELALGICELLTRFAFLGGGEEVLGRGESGEEVGCFPEPCMGDITGVKVISGEE